MASYTASSPWGKTGSVGGRHLDILNIRPVPAEDDDILYEIESQYTHRPDLLSYDLYGTPKLWWVFAQRNPNQLKDPYWDFVTGISIYIPKLSMLTEVLGL